MLEFVRNRKRKNTPRNSAHRGVAKRRLVLEGLEDRRLMAVNITSAAYTQNFDSLANSGSSSTLPAGWEFTETGSGANTTYSAGDGTLATGDTYSFGAAGATDRALGQLRSGSVVTVFGASFTNNSGTGMVGFSLAFNYERWRNANSTRSDSIDFQYSLNATSLSTGTWVDVNSLDYSAIPPDTTSGAGNATINRVAASATVSALSIPAGATFYIRWVDLDVTGPDDGVGIDDLTLTPVMATAPVVTAPSNASIVYGANATFTASATGNPTPSTVSWETFVGGNWTTISGTTDGSIYTGFSTNTLTVTKPSVSLSNRLYRATYTTIGGTTSSTSATLTVSARTLNLSGTASNKTYNGSNAASSSVAITNSGNVLSGDTVGASVTGTFSDANVGTGKTVNLSYLLTGASAANYAIGTSNATTTANIIAKSLAVTGTVSNKTYDGTTSSTATATVNAADLVVGETVTATVVGTFSDRNAGVGKTVNLTQYTLVGAQASNYVLGTTNATTTANIDKLGLTVTAVSHKKTFDGTTNSAISPSVAPSIASGDTSALIQSFDSATVGTGKVLTPSGLVNDGNGGANYTYSFQPDSTGEITPVAVAVGALNGGVSFLNPNQRSQLVSVVVNFNVPVTLSAGAFSLVNLDNSTSISASQLVISPSSGPSTSFTITFGDGTGVISRSGGTTLGANANSLADGNYQLTVDKAKVLDGNGTAMATDYLLGNTFGQNFFRLFGDSDGDGDVDATDNNNFRRAQTVYNAALDYNGNGSVDVSDALPFRSNLNKRRRSF